MLDLWALRQLDLALTKYFPINAFSTESTLRVRLDVLNVLNAANYVNYVGNGTSPQFGEFDNFGIGGNPPRTFKLSLGMSF